MNDGDIATVIIVSIVVPLSVVLLVAVIFFLARKKKVINLSAIELEGYKNKPKEALEIFVKGKKMKQSNNREKAVQYFTEAIALDPNLVEAYRKRAAIYFAQNQYDMALVDLNKAISLDAYNPSAYKKRGILHAAMQKCQLAINDFTDSLRLKFDEQVCYQRGTEFKELGKYDSAAQDFTTVINKNPNYIDAYIQLIDVLLLSTQYDKAMSVCSEAIKLKATIDTYKKRGECYIYLKQYEAALKDFEQCIQMNTTDPMICIMKNSFEHC